MVGAEHAVRVVGGLDLAQAVVGVGPVEPGRVRALLGEVEVLLSAAYRKLGIRSRRDLPAALA